MKVSLYLIQLFCIGEMIAAALLLAWFAWSWRRLDK